MADDMAININYSLGKDQTVDDIVTLLRTVVAVPHGVDIWTTTALEAADEIERLTEWRKNALLALDKREAEIERLRAAGDALAEALRELWLTGDRAPLRGAVATWQEALRG